MRRWKPYFFIRNYLIRPLHGHLPQRGRCGGCRCYSLFADTCWFAEGRPYQSPAGDSFPARGEALGRNGLIRPLRGHLPLRGRFGDCRCYLLFADTCWFAEGRPHQSPAGDSFPARGEAWEGTTSSVRCADTFPGGEGLGSSFPQEIKNSHPEKTGWEQIVCSFA